MTSIFDEISDVISEVGNPDRNDSDGFLSEDAGDFLHFEDEEQFNTSTEVMNNMESLSEIQNTTISDTKLLLNEVSENKDEDGPIITEVDYYEDSIKQIFSHTVVEVNKKLMKHENQNMDIERLRSVLKSFDNWFLANDKSNYKNRYDRGNAYTHADSSKIYDFVFYDKEIDAFAVSFSDIYVNVVIKDRNYRRDALENINTYLREHFGDEVIIVAKLSTEFKTRRKLILNFLGRKTQFIIQVNIELLLRQNNLFKMCSLIDERFLVVGTFLTFWAHYRDILRDDYLNSYTLYLMLVYFMSVQNPPVLPDLYNKDLNKIRRIHRVKHRNQLKGIKDKDIPNRELIIDLNYELHPKDVGMLKKKLSEKNELTAGELLVRFFYMFAYEIPDIGMKVSVKKRRLAEPFKEIDGYSVEDPFINERDTCRNLNAAKSKAFKVVNKEFKRAYDLIATGGIEELGQRINQQSAYQK